MPLGQPVRLAPGFGWRRFSFCEATCCGGLDRGRFVTLVKWSRLHPYMARSLWISRGDGDLTLDILRPGHDSRAVANRILEIARNKGISLTIMQLVKLIYFANGWWLAFKGESLSKHPAQAWQYGPVYPLVYKPFSKEGPRPLTRLISDRETGKVYSDRFDEEEERMLDWVVERYGRMPAFKLSQMTHTPDGPWQATVNEQGHYKDISEALTKAHFTRYVADAR